MTDFKILSKEGGDLKLKREVSDISYDTLQISNHMMSSLLSKSQNMGIGCAAMSLDELRNDKFMK